MGVTDVLFGPAMFPISIVLIFVIVYLINKCLSIISFLSRERQRESSYTNESGATFEDEVDAGRYTLDLHGYSVNSALEQVEGFLWDKKNTGWRKCTVITGQGLHSPHGIPKIKPAVEKYLKKHGYRYDDKGGFLHVYL